MSLKITSGLLQPTGAGAALSYSAEEFLDNAAIAGIPGWAVLSAIAAFYSWLTYVVLRHPLKKGELAHGQVHV